MKLSIGTKRQALNFPNESRSFDETRNRVCFWGYDSAIEISFYVAAEALQAINPEMEGTAEGILHSFDAARERIHEVANKVYAGTDQGTYAVNLTADDLKYTQQRNC